MRQQDISDFTENPVRDYVGAVDNCGSRTELLKMLKEEWLELAPDAINQVKAMPSTPQGFAWFKQGLESTRSREFPGPLWASKYGAVTMPALMMQATIWEQEYELPWGLCVLRLLKRRRLH